MGLSNYLIQSSHSALKEINHCLTNAHTVGTAVTNTAVSHTN